MNRTPVDKRMAVCTIRFMSLPINKNKRDRGFTLIELLVVITIIAVLAALLFPVGNAVMNNSRKTEASADEVRIVNACMAYQTDYGKLPINSNQANGGGSDTCYGDPGGHALYPGYELYDILRAIPNSSDQFNSTNQLNPRQVVYLQSSNAKNPSNPREGFLLKDFNDGNYTIKAGALVDPWGNEYVVWLDVNGDGDLTTGASWFYNDYSGKPVGYGPQGAVAVASMGADNGWGTKGNQLLAGSDDVVTWNK